MSEGQLTEKGQSPKTSNEGREKAGVPQELWCEEGEKDGTVDEGDGAEDHDGGELARNGNTWLMKYDVF
jgi:hypothetical protein